MRNDYEKPGISPAFFVDHKEFQLMEKMNEHSVFGTKPKTPQTRAEITDSTSRAIIQEEADERAALTRKLREARLEMEAKNPAPATPKRKPPVTPKFRKY
ncbi:MAG: hypothetical protein GYB36_09950 [Alphaproteobacteria bacterium]|nr:hypothetical protein [Alphaproteobacteria bacterium]